ncbi:hypothetical protein [Microlunatus sp. GCM10028923]|uniref:hypothetical protein n=1 Tax=Microlunatus sp. GCM10028923 TaxID=3273400 RepID=UPI003606B772
MTMSGLSAGAATADITPPVGIQLAGSFEPRASARVERPLMIRVLALAQGGTVLLLISCDLLLFRREDLVDEAKQLIMDRLAVPADRVLISATHTHYGPATFDHAGAWINDHAYLATLPGKITEAAAAALDRRVDARIAAGTGTVTGICFNRRYRRTDGTVEMNPGYGRDDLVGPAGPVDPTVTALLVEDLAGRPIALWANLSLHYVGVDEPDSISSDYFGVFAERVAALLGDDVVGILTNGASGDINNIDLDRVVDADGSRRSVLVADAVLGAALTATTMSRRDPAPLLSARLAPVTARRWPVGEADLALARRITAGERLPADYGYVEGMPIPEALIPYYTKELGELAALPESRPSVVGVIGIGDVALVALPGEVFVEFGLAIKAASPYPITAVVGLANDHLGYLPTRAAFADGGYETWRSSISWTAPGTGEDLVASATEELTRLRKG